MHMPVYHNARHKTDYTMHTQKTNHKLNKTISLLFTGSESIVKYT